MKLLDLLARELESWPEYEEFHPILYITQGASSEVMAWEYGGLEYNKGLWISKHGIPADEILWDLQLSEDHSTAIITREMWQSARDKLKGESAMQKPKANKDGWIRHRGGLCPVKCDTKVDVRYRDGSVHNGVVYGQSPECIDWKHDGVDSDIMAYRIHAPDLPSESMEPEPGMISFGPPVIDYKGVEAIPTSLKDQQVGRAYRENPLQWRDRIKEIDADQEAADAAYKEATDHRSAQRAELVAKLKAEGLALISEPIKAEDSAEVDMGDWRNWVVGDLVEVLDPESSGLGKGDIVKIIEIDFEVDEDEDEDEATFVPCKLKGANTWLYFRNMKWHSRPSKP